MEVDFIPFPLFLCMCKIFHFTMWGNVLSLPVSFSPFKSPIPAKHAPCMHCVRLCLWQHSSLGNFSAWKSLLFQQHPGQLSPPLRRLLQLLQSERLCLLCARGCLWSVYIPVIANTVLQCHHPSPQETVNTSVNETRSHHPMSMQTLSPVLGLLLALNNSLLN